MPGDRTNPTPDDVRAAWEQFRDATFMLIGDAKDCTLWVWSAGQEFDFVAAGTHLVGVPEVKVDIGPGALALTAYGALHLVPMTSLSAGSLDVMQPEVVFQLGERQAQLRAAQRQAIDHFAQLVRERFSVKASPPSAHGQQTH